MGCLRGLVWLACSMGETMERLEMGSQMERCRGCVVLGFSQLAKRDDVWHLLRRNMRFYAGQLMYMQ